MSEKAASSKKFAVVRSLAVQSPLSPNGEKQASGKTHVNQWHRTLHTRSIRKTDSSMICVFNLLVCMISRPINPKPPDTCKECTPAERTKKQQRCQQEDQTRQQQRSM